MSTPTTWSRCSTPPAWSGAYVACRLAVRHPERVARLVLVDGGLEIAGAREADPQEFLAAFAGAAVAKLRDEYPDELAFRASWLLHPGVAGSDIDLGVLEALADRDRTGQPPHLRSSLSADAVWADAADLFAADDAERMDTEAVELYAEYGMSDDTPPMHPSAIAGRWAERSPERRRAVLVPGANHLSIIAGARGAEVVAGEIASAVDGR
jgi:lipase